MQIEVPARAIVVAIKAGYRLLQPLRPLRLLTERKLPPALAKHAVHIASADSAYSPAALVGCRRSPAAASAAGCLPDQSLHQLVDYLHRRRFVAMNGAGKYQPALAARACGVSSGSFPRASASGNGPSRRESDGAIAPPGLMPENVPPRPLIAEMDKPNRAAGSGSTDPARRALPAAAAGRRGRPG